MKRITICNYWCVVVIVIVVADATYANGIWMNLNGFRRASTGFNGNNNEYEKIYEEGEKFAQKIVFVFFCARLLFFLLRLFQLKFHSCWIADSVV